MSETATNNRSWFSPLVGLALGVLGGVITFSMKTVNEHAERITALEVKFEIIDRTTRAINTKNDEILKAVNTKNDEILRRLPR